MVTPHVPCALMSAPALRRWSTQPEQPPAEAYMSAVLAHTFRALASAPASSNSAMLSAEPPATVASLEPSTINRFRTSGEPVRAASISATRRRLSRALTSAPAWIKDSTHLGQANAAAYMRAVTPFSLATLTSAPTNISPSTQVGKLLVEASIRGVWPGESRLGASIPAAANSITSSGQSLDKWSAIEFFASCSLPKLLQFRKGTTAAKKNCTWVRILMPSGTSLN
mmetsp:Transcript_38856/g.70759  ORF Transcript_38856/g.70759 Transcript_38856/m.70759 type:complete len:226 (+) Transcript_38856:1753-2430(+)